jgi:DNA-binding MarR family transcriptional regulator
MAPASTRTLAERVWRAMFDLLMRSAPQRTDSLARRGLTPNDSRALFTLEPGSGRPMRSLADEWDCDPSYATLIVDRLEALGLAVRRPGAADKRVKEVRLTRAGERTRQALRDEFHRPPPELEQLPRPDLEALARALARLEAPVVPARRARRRSGTASRRTPA